MIREALKRIGDVAVREFLAHGDAHGCFAGCPSLQALGSISGEIQTRLDLARGHNGEARWLSPWVVSPILNATRDFRSQEEFELAAVLS